MTAQFECEPFMMLLLQLKQLMTPVPVVLFIYPVFSSSDVW